jgi:hypothetical protein
MTSPRAWELEDISKHLSCQTRALFEVFAQQSHYSIDSAPVILDYLASHFADAIP